MERVHAGPRGAFTAGSLDSLAAVELAAVLAAELGLPVPGTLVFDYPTVAAIAAFLHAQLARAAGAAAPQALPAPQAALVAHAGGARELGQLLAVRSTACSGVKSCLCADPPTSAVCSAQCACHGQRAKQKRALFGLSTIWSCILCSQSCHHTLKVVGAESLARSCQASAHAQRRVVHRWHWRAGRRAALSRRPQPRRPVLQSCPAMQSRTCRSRGGTSRPRARAAPRWARASAGAWQAWPRLMRRCSASLRPRHSSWTRSSVCCSRRAPAVASPF